MFKGKTSLFLLLALLCTVVWPAQAQDGPVYIVVDYMKVPHDAVGAYLDLEQDVFKAVHQERIRRGNMIGWELYQVLYAPVDAPYNYLTINAFSDLDHLTIPFSTELMQAAHPGMDVAAIMQKTTSARELVHSEVWTFVDGVGIGSEDVPGPYLVASFSTVPAGGAAEYVAVEREIWKPIHQVRKDGGYLDGWGMYQLMMPGGDVVPYSYSVANFYERLSDITGGFPMELVQQAHPGVTENQMNEMMNRTFAARSFHKTEVWRRLDRTQ